MFDLTAAALQFIKAGKIRGLAVTSVTRTPSLPDLPPIGDFLPGGGDVLRRHRRAEEHVGRDRRQAQQNDQCRLHRPKFKARLADLGGDGMPGTPADFTKVIADETDKWGKVVKFAGLKAE